MCFSYSVNFSATRLQSKLNLSEVPQLPEPGYFISGFTYPCLPVIAGNGGLHTEYAYWGLIPDWVKSTEKAIEMRSYGLNAKGETLNQKPMFKKAFEHHRVLVPMAGFYEWRQIGKRKFPYYIKPTEADFFLVAGLASQWANPDTGEEQETFTIVTCPSGPLLSTIHNSKLRQPLILPEEDWQTWIYGRETDVLPLVKPCSDSLLSAFTVGPLASYTKQNRNVPTVQQPFDYPETGSQLF